MEPQWYYARDGVQYGPVTEAELRQKTESGEVRGSDLIWKKGMSDWVPARSVPEIRSKREQPPSSSAVAPPLPLPKWDDSRELDWDRFQESAKLHVRRAFTWDLQAITPTPDERSYLEAAGVADTSGQRYAVWRRSLLLIIVGPTALAGLFALLRLIWLAKGLSGVGITLVVIYGLSICALPVFAILAAGCYERIKESQRILRIGVLISLVVPALLMLAPVDWWTGSPRLDADPFMDLFLLLMPVVLTLLPGLSRACFRIKMLLPQSVTAGWPLLASAPLQLIFTVVALLFIYFSIPNLVLMLGLLFTVGAPLLYLTRARLFTRPLSRTQDLPVLSRLQGYVAVSICIGIALLVIFVFGAELPGGRRIVGFSYDSSILQPWSIRLHEWWLEYVGRSLLMTVLFADLLMRMNLSIWRQEQLFYRTPEAADFDRMMINLCDNVDGIKFEVPTESTPPPPQEPAPAPEITPAEAMAKQV